MVTNRIRVAKDKAELMQNLLATGSTKGPFQTYADAVVFAATLGMKNRRKTPLETISTREPGPISWEIFASRGYDPVIRLMAIAHTQQPEILASFNPGSEEQRLRIFEEYANGGLEILRDGLRGAVDYTERILLLLSSERWAETPEDEEFDLSRFL